MPFSGKQNNPSLAEIEVFDYKGKAGESAFSLLYR